MAFVNRSNREIESAKNDTSVGPGKYLSPNTWENRKQSAAPFNTSSSRRGVFENNSIPGPGTYHQIIVSNTAKTKKEMPYLYSDYDNDNVFISSEKRFKSEQGDNKPGPGEYNLAASPKLYIKEKYLYGAIKPKNFSLSNERVLSIPSKERSFGYQVSSSGLITVSNDPDQTNKFTGEKNDSIAPNQYNIKEPFKRNNIIDWKRSDTNDRTEKKIEVSQRLDSGSVIKGNEYLITSENKGKKKVQLPRVLRNKRVGLASKDDKSDIDFVLFTEKKSTLPGPGAYSPYSFIDSKRYLPLPFNHQHFGSSLSRSNVVNTSGNQGIGPGQYFKDESMMKKHHSKGNDIIRHSPHSLNSNNSQFKQILLAREKSPHLIGPGSYEVDKSSFATDKGPSSIESFGCLEKRFNNISLSEKNNIPGAGSYINLNKWADPAKMHKFKPHPIDIRTVEKGSIPGVGEYHPEVFHSIEFNLQNKKYSKAHIAPFESNSKRFLSKPQTNINLGPGTYELDNSERNINKRLGMPLRNTFNTNTTHNDNTHMKDSSTLGPGAYDINSYFEWNKKSFNALFS